MQLKPKPSIYVMNQGSKYKKVLVGREESHQGQYVLRGRSKNFQFTKQFSA
jgi:hypothetical protein